MTQSSEARLVVQDVRSCESTRQTLTLLEILAIGQKQIERGDHVGGDDFFGELNKLDYWEEFR